MKTLIFTLFLCLCAVTASAQPKEEKLRVATRLVRPFVFEENGRLTGFSVELWQQIALHMNVQSEFVVKPTVRDLLASVDDHDANLGIAGIPTTAERELKGDFSQPMFEAGLQILIPIDASRGSFVKAIATNLFSSAVLPYVSGVAFFLIFIAHWVWWLERRNPTGMLTHRSYYPGIFETCWWAASTLAPQADQMPRTALARIVAVFWMFTS